MCIWNPALRNNVILCFRGEEGGVGCDTETDFICGWDNLFRNEMIKDYVLINTN